jgi:uncharacterized protein
MQANNTTRSISPDMNPAAVAEIDARLDGVEREHGVRIGFAIESGSRAWGFPSPDSDYDCRFVYVRSAGDYMALYPARDVIETPMTPVLDVNGWDLQKALKLLVAGNAVIVEWLTSPIVYRADAGFRQRFLALAHDIGERRAFAMHYLHLARRQLPLITDDPQNAPLKKIFYVLRPALALRWLRCHPGEPLAPMHFPTLCEGADLTAGLRDDIAELLAKKAVTRELGTGPVPASIHETILTELGRAEADHPPFVSDRAPAEAKAQSFFLEAVRTFES